MILLSTNIFLKPLKANDELYKCVRNTALITVGGAAAGGCGTGAITGTMIFPIVGTTFGCVAGGFIGGIIGSFTVKPLTKKVCL